MNPFTNNNKTISNISFSCTNIRSLGLSTTGLTLRKLNSILRLDTDVNILLDTKTSLTDTQGIFNSFELKYKLANHRHIGTYTTTKGIIVIYNKNKTALKNIKINREGRHLVSNSR